MHAVADSAHFTAVNYSRNFYSIDPQLKIAILFLKMTKSSTIKFYTLSLMIGYIKLECLSQDNIFGMLVTNAQAYLPGASIKKFCC